MGEVYNKYDILPIVNTLHESFHILNDSNLGDSSDTVIPPKEFYSLSYIYIFI